MGTLFVSLGGHLAVLQTIAWGNMLRDFSRSTSLEDAAKKTFDGAHPCALCKVVKESRKQEEKSPMLKTESKMDVLVPQPIRMKPLHGTPLVMVIPGYLRGSPRVFIDTPRRPPRLA